MKVFFVLLLALLWSLQLATTAALETYDDNTNHELDSVEDLLGVLSEDEEVVLSTDEALENAVLLRALGKDQVQTADAYLLVSLADGQIVALDEDSGRKVWSIDTGSPLVTSSVGRDHGSENGGEAAVEGIFPSTDGSLYTYFINEAGRPEVKKLPVSVKDLVDSSPSPTPQGTMMLGSQQTVVFIIDIEKGLVLKTISGDENDVFMFLRSPDPQTHVEKDFFDGSTEKTIAITRKNFIVRSIHPSLGEQWNVTWSQLDKMPLLEIYGHGAEVDREDLKLLLAPDFSLKRFDPSTGAELWSVPFVVPPTVAYPASGKPIDLLESTKKLMNMAVGSSSSDKALVERGGGPLEVSETLVVGEIDGKLFGMRAPFFKKKTLIDERMGVDEVIMDEEANVGSHRDEHALIPSQAVVGNVAGKMCRDSNGVCRIPVGFYPLVENSTETKLLYLPKCMDDEVDSCEDEEEEKSQGMSLVQMTVVAGTTVLLVIISRIYSNKSGKKDDSSANSGRVAVELENGNIRVGRLEVSKKVLGYGSGGTAVYEGLLDGRKVAVKRMLKQLVELAKQEIEALIDSDEHPNVVRCFALEEDNEFIYLALERCDMSLADALETSKLNNMKFRIIDSDGNITRTPLAFQVARDIAEGVNAVHTRGIVHRDLKPHNVLLNSSGRAKLSDMGLSKKLVDNQASFETLGAGGSPGWQAPEQLIVRGGGNARLTASVDVFSSGMLVYYCLTGGKHPYGESYSRDSAIMKDEKDLSPIEDVPCAVNLISAMLSNNAENRPKSDEILEHPMWWTAHDRLAFLSDFSDRVEVENRADDDSAFVALESLSTWAIASKDGWLDRLDQIVINSLVKYRKYDSHSLRDLLRVVRNKYSHYREMPADVQKQLGSIPDGFLAYFETRFPNLVISCFYFALKWYPNDSIFKKYFNSDRAKGLLETCAPPPMKDPEVRDAALAEAKARIDSQKQTIKAILEEHAQNVAKNGNGTPGVKRNPMSPDTTEPKYVPSPLLPRKPWMIPCEFYIKTGTCKFGAECRFDHPPEHQVSLNEYGLPIRPGEPKCSHFERTLTCKYGAACKYDHSLN